MRLLPFPLALLIAPPIAAEAPPAQSPGLSAVLDCRKLADRDARLGCFDRATAALGAALDARDLVVVDRAEVRRTRKSLFGFVLPSLKLFGGEHAKPDPRDEPEITELTTKIRSARGIGNGRYSLQLEEGGTWETTESGLIDDLEGGETIKIRRGAMGGYLANIASARALRVRRVN